MFKRIFISDIHMGDKRSVSQGPKFHNYSWFYHPDASPDTDRPKMLSQFLKQYCIDDSSVGEVVIVGDLFDEWVCPAGFDPTEPPYPTPLPPGEQYRRIATAPQNKGVIEALRTLASANRLVYVPGNHDMFADRSIIEEIFPGIHCPGSIDGHCVYKADGIWAEHGHWYGMFNAPLPPGANLGFPGCSLPLGHFITRILAEENLRTGKMIGMGQVFKEWIAHILDKVPDVKNPDIQVGDLVDAILMDLLRTLIAKHAHGAEGAVMNGFAGISGLVKWQDIMAQFPNVYDSWPDLHPDNLGRLDALWADADRLDQAARLITLNNHDAKIVICGHTHYSDLVTIWQSYYPPDEAPPEDKHIYVNTGAWTNDAPVCTFVETELHPETHKHLVCLRKWFRNPSTGRYDAENVLPDGWVTAMIYEAAPPVFAEADDSGGSRDFD